ETANCRPDPVTVVLEFGCGGRTRTSGFAVVRSLRFWFFSSFCPCFFRVFSLGLLGFWGVRLSVSLPAVLQLTAQRVPLVVGRRDVVAPEHRVSSMSGDGHCHGLRHAGADHVPDRCSAVVVKELPGEACGLPRDCPCPAKLGLAQRTAAA